MLETPKLAVGGTSSGGGLGGWGVTAIILIILIGVGGGYMYYQKKNPPAPPTSGQYGGQYTKEVAMPAYGNAVQTHTHGITPPPPPGAPPPSYGNLPPGWQAMSDPASGATYYYNATSGESTWTRPTGGYA